MVVRVPHASIATLRALIDEHLRQEYSWPGGESFEDIELDESDFVEFLYAALDYSRDAHPWTDQGGATVDDAAGARNPASTDLFKALLYLEPRTPEAVIASTRQSSGIHSRMASRSTWGLETCVLEHPCSPCW